MSKRIWHKPIWKKDGMPSVMLTKVEHKLILQMESENVNRPKVLMCARKNAKFYMPAILNLIILYKHYLKTFQFIKAYKLKKVLKIYEIL